VPLDPDLSFDFAPSPTASRLAVLDGLLFGSPSPVA
jgi:hypothetical protein